MFRSQCLTVCLLTALDPMGHPQTAASKIIPNGRTIDNPQVTRSVSFSAHQASAPFFFVSPAERSGDRRRLGVKMPKP